ncbi:MAG: HAD-IIIA family hydrolase [Gemmatimonadaceae bacterium]|nr:HAD-IIIA family hydrolase [Gemmatimonadaceae bacterium]
MSGALFIDRDGTLIADAHYLSDASRVRLLPRSVEAVQLANAAGVPVYIVTNQSGIARGLITEAEYEATRVRTETLLADAGAPVAGTYHCPHWPDVSGPCDCRKPGIGLYRQAATAHALDLASSAYIGDRWRDVAPALEGGGIGILVPGIETPATDVEQTRSALSARIHIADNLVDAVRLALAFIAPQSGASDAPPSSSDRS